MKKFASLAVLVLVNHITIFSQSLTITPGQSAVQLVDNFVTSTGIVTSNVSGTFASQSAATFVNAGLQSINLTGGIILSTGNLNGINNPSAALMSGNLFMPGDTDLNNIVSPFTTHDAQVLTFDFKAGSDSVEFYFVFASEEYNEFVYSGYNDVFAFFVTGPGYTPNTNVALIPGTTIPISVNTVNNGYAQGVATGPCTNCSYFVDNVGTSVPYSMDGFSTTIKIKFPVTTCADYTFKIAIADVNDGILDSQVLLEENSFIPCPLMQPVQRLSSAPTTVSLCSGGVVILSAPPAVSYLWSTGDTTQTIVVTQPGTYSYIVSANSCLAVSTSVNVVQQGSVQAPAIIQQNNVLVSNTTGQILSYQWYLDDVIIPGANQADYEFASIGCYTLSVYTSSGCEALSNVVCVTNVGLQDAISENIVISPNPSYGNAEIKSPFKKNTTTTLRIYDISGRLMSDEKINDNGKLIIERREIIKGTYLIELANSDSDIKYRSKIVFL